MSTEYVYLIEANRLYKIGRTKDINKRMKQLQTGNPHAIILIKLYETENSIKLEAYIHQTLKDQNIRNEWFRLDNPNSIDTIVSKYDRSVKFIEHASMLPNDERIKLRILFEREEKLRSILETKYSLAYKKYLILAEGSQFYYWCITNNPIMHEYGVLIDKFKKLEPNHRSN